MTHINWLRDFMFLRAYHEERGVYQDFHRYIHAILFT